ncbi:MarR family winged helix-turn-helix transcriptional regulator [Candidatus Thioglobus autotrophicus]|uniref:MarR family winged helix-turn-helix transcriptional regulator n=1 Tax=Candidatus Thioglobus autotrophicus TaxID=1705394 RepID=UPI0006B404EE|nr:MarR family transcriptional regulator [Candidatus Thioglobus autotrophicus]WPE16004.1 MarR family transcriptional regulator [Candidatus Thioglobus autotrophicus]WPE17463.1 MarR family transcriptional regulator [Candidatus Thioglobus autotrophicus]
MIKVENTEIRFHENWPDIDVNLAMVVLNLGRASSQFNLLVEAVCEQFNLSVFELEVMVLLRSFPYPHRLTPSLLSSSLMVSSGGLTKVLIKLESKGYIVRDANPTDKRSKIVRLTKLGIGFIEKYYPQVQYMSKQFFESKLSKRELALLTTLLTKLLKD